MPQSIHSLVIYIAVMLCATHTAESARHRHRKLITSRLSSTSYSQHDQSKSCSLHVVGASTFIKGPRIWHVKLFISGVLAVHEIYHPEQGKHKELPSRTMHEKPKLSCRLCDTILRMTLFQQVSHVWSVKTWGPEKGPGKGMDTLRLTKQSYAGKSSHQ